MSLNELNYRVLAANGTLIAVVRDATLAAVLLALESPGAQVRVAPSKRSTVFTLTEDNEDQVADSVDWTTDEILAGEKASYQARRGQAVLDRI